MTEQHLLIFLFAHEVPHVVMRDPTGPGNKLPLGIVAIPSLPQGKVRLLEQLLGIRVVSHQREDVAVNPILIADEKFAELFVPVVIHSEPSSGAVKVVRRPARRETSHIIVRVRRNWPSRKVTSKILDPGSGSKWLVE